MEINQSANLTTGLGNMNIPLNTAKYELDAAPRFPLEAFPLRLADVIGSLNAGAGYNIDFTASSMLYAAAIAIGGTHRVKILEGWTESPIIFLALVAGPGSGKSHPLKFAVSPIREKDGKSHDQYQLETTLFEETQRIAKKGQEIVLNKPIWRKHLLGDYTIEALAVKHQENLRGIGVCTDELAGWFKNFNRYSKGSEQEFWLATWSGDPINIDRKSSGPIYIRTPFICVAGTTQPVVLNRLAADDRADNGFLDRMLFVIPEVKKEPWRTEGIQPALKETWSLIINRLLDLECLNPDTPNIVHYTPDAYAALLAWQAHNTHRMNEDISYESTGAKMDTYCPRLSLILHALRSACEAKNLSQIGLEDVEGAITLVKYFTANALRVRKILTGDPLAMVPTNRQKLYNSLPDQFTTAQGVELATVLDISESTAKRFFSDKKVFNRLSHGSYQKIIINN